MKFSRVALLSFFIASPAFAAQICGVLTAEKVFCVRAPCPAIVSLNTGRGRPFVVRAEETSEAMRFLTRLSSGKYNVCIKGQIERETLIRAESIRLHR